MDWSITNFILNSLSILLLLFVWYKQPFQNLEALLRKTKEQESRSKVIGDSLMEALIVTREDGVIIEYNKAAMTIFGYPEGKLKGMNVVSLVPDKYKQKHLDGMIKAVKGEPNRVIGHTIDTEGMRVDGSLFPIALSVSRVYTTDEGLLFVAVIRDITERNMIMEDAMQLNKALTTRLAAIEAFNQSVCHDLNAPLRSIEGFSEILEQDYLSKLEAQGQDYIRRIRRSVCFMRQLIKDMMRLTRVTQAHTKLDVQEISLANLFKAMISEHRMMDPQRNVEVKVPDDMVVRGDAELLTLVASNLVSNAWKYTSLNPNPLIEIGYNTVNGEKVYYIRDNGVGFNQARVGELFQPFLRLHNQKEFEGSGIGLTIVKRVIELHRGRVWAEGVEGKGATFYFTIGL